MDFADRDGLIWMDGAVVPWREARVHVLTHGLHYGSSVFEGERAYAGRVFKLREHTERLFRSAKRLAMEIPFTVGEIDAATEAVLSGSGLVDAYLRPVAWRGSEAMGLAPGDTRTHVAIACWAWPSYFSPGRRMEGIRLQTSRWARPAPNTAPWDAKASGLYMICTLAKKAAEDAGFDDALMLDWRGFLAESTGSNLFLVIDGALHTPAPTSFLDGITRRTVMGIARELGIEVVERDIHPGELDRAKEVFVTGTAIEVMPIRQVDDRAFEPSDVTRLLMDAYSKLVRADPSPSAEASGSEPGRACRQETRG